ncbi:MAG: hypothetical protein ACRDTX_29230 [Pseudonocardiaceae bacterium]
MGPRQDRVAQRVLRLVRRPAAGRRRARPVSADAAAAHHEGDLVAATILVRVGAHAWYSYGVSSTEKREVRSSNALQWAMIRDSLATGWGVYDLRGITPPSTRTTLMSG